MTEPDQPKALADLIREAADKLYADAAERPGQPFRLPPIIRSPRADDPDYDPIYGDGTGEPLGVLNVVKHAAYLQMSADEAMDAGLIPDTRPIPPPPSRWQRVRRAVRDRVQRGRWWLGIHVGSWIAGEDLTPRD